MILSDIGTDLPRQTKVIGQLFAPGTRKFRVSSFGFRVKNKPARKQEFIARTQNSKLETLDSKLGTRNYLDAPTTCHRHHHRGCARTVDCAERHQLCASHRGK